MSIVLAERSNEPYRKRVTVITFKAGKELDRLIKKAAEHYGFDSKSELIRYIICRALDNLGLIETREERRACQPYGAAELDKAIAEATRSLGARRQ